VKFIFVRYFVDISLLLENHIYIYKKFDVKYKILFIHLKEVI